MKLAKLFDPTDRGRPMRVAGFMSGSGTNIIRLIERERRLKEERGASPFNTVFIFSDRADGRSLGERIALENGLPYFSFDIRAFHRIREIRRSVEDPAGMEARSEFDAVAGRLIRAFDIDIIALGGYMSYTTLGPCVNVHPADLSLVSADGKRRYVGDHAVLDAIAAGEKFLRSSTLWTDRGVDTGPLLMVSDPVKVDLPVPLKELLADRDRLRKTADLHQQRLKEAGDWQIFPATVEMIADGRFALDETGNIYVDGMPAPEGYRG